MIRRKQRKLYLEYLFLIKDEKLLKEFRGIKDKVGGVLEVSIDEIREKYIEDQGKIKVARNLLDVLDDETIAKKTELDIEIIRELRKEK